MNTKTETPNIDALFDKDTNYYQGDIAMLDWGDAYGALMMIGFAYCGLMHVCGLGEKIPEEVQYNPSPMLKANCEESLAVVLEEDFLADMAFPIIKVDDMVEILEAVSADIDYMKENGLDY